MANLDRSRSPAQRPPAPPPVAPRYPGFPRWHGPMGTSTRLFPLQFRPQLQGRWPMTQPSPPMVPNLSQNSNMMMGPSQSFPPSPPRSFPSFIPSTSCSPTQPCPATPSQSSNCPTSMAPPPQRRNLQPTGNQCIKEYGLASTTSGIRMLISMTTRS